MLKLGIVNPDDIEVLGASIAEARRNFEPVPGTFAAAPR